MSCVCVWVWCSDVVVLFSTTDTIASKVHVYIILRVCLCSECVKFMKGLGGGDNYSWCQIISRAEITALDEVDPAQQMPSLC